MAPRVFGGVWEREDAGYAQVAFAGCPRRAPNTRELAEGVLLRRDASQQDISFTRGVVRAAKRELVSRSHAVGTAAAAGSVDFIPPDLAAFDIADEAASKLSKARIKTNNQAAYGR